MKQVCHPEASSQDVLSHSNSWYSQFLACDGGNSSILTWDVPRMDKSILHDTERVYCSEFASIFTRKMRR